MKRLLFVLLLLVGLSLPALGQAAAQGASDHSLKAGSGPARLPSKRSSLEAVVAPLQPVGIKPYPATLRPVRIAVGEDTLFGFGREQVRYLMQLVGEGEFDRQALRIREQQVDTLKAQVRTRGVVIGALKTEVDYQQQRLDARDAVIARQREQATVQEARARALERELARQRRRTRWVWWAAGVAFLIGLWLRKP